MKKVRSARESQHVLEIMHQTQERDERIADFLEVRNQEKDRHKQEKEELQRKRQRVRDAKKKREDKRRAELRKAIEDKGHLSEQLSAERQAEIMFVKVEQDPDCQILEIRNASPVRAGS